MAFGMDVTGMDELLQRMDKLGEKAQEVASGALYEGAGVMADSISQAVHGIATEPFRYATGGRQRMASPEEKAILLQARKGVAKFKKTGVSVNTSVGMQNSGYATLNGKTKPIPLIANSINHGTSFMKKQPFMRKALNTGKATAAIESGLRKRLDELSQE